ncbi:MAG: hypothetical protein FWH41_05700 [Treponema sp.]|nr:hypothetical protein [Treponema sp.]
MKTEKWHLIAFLLFELFLFAACLQNSHAEGQIGSNYFNGMWLFVWL